jgi:hypothetical protein
MALQNKTRSPIYSNKTRQRVVIGEPPTTSNSMLSVHNLENLVFHAFLLYNCQTKGTTKDFDKKMKA